MFVRLVQSVSRLNEMERVQEIKVLQSARKKLAVLGFIPNHQKNNHWKFNGRQKSFLICNFLLINSLIIFDVREAKGTEEHMATIFVIVAALASAL